MEILLLLVPISVLLMIGAGGVLIWAVNARQFERLDEHALDILDEDS